MKRLGMLFLAGVFVLTNSFFVFGQTTDSLVSEEQGNEYNYSIQEIVDEVNQKYGTDIQLDEPLPSERTITDVNTNKLTKEEFSAILNKKAAKIAEHRAAVRKQFESRTGRAPFEKPENVNYNDSTRAATIKNYSKTKEIEYIPPAIPNSTTFAAVRAGARYAHATTKGGGADISVNVSGKGNVTFTLSHSKENSHVQSYGARQKVFYNNGSVVVE